MSIIYKKIMNVNRNLQLFNNSIFLSFYDFKCVLHSYYRRVLILNEFECFLSHWSSVFSLDPFSKLFDNIRVFVTVKWIVKVGWDEVVHSFELSHNHTCPCSKILKRSYIHIATYVIACAKTKNALSRR